MNFSRWISYRLRLNGSNNGANATGVVIAVTGVTLAIIIMEFTIAIVLGFKNQITERIMGFDGQLWVLPAYNFDTGTSQQTLDFDPVLDGVIDQVVPDGSKYARYSQPGILKTETDFSGVYFTGFDEGYEAKFERANIVEGEFPDFSDADNSRKIVLSVPVANSLGLHVGDDINACFFVNDAIKARKFQIAGLYQSGFGDYDRTIAYAAIDALRKIGATDSLSATQISVSLPADADIEGVASDLQQALIDLYQSGQIPNLYPVDNVKHTGAIYFNWLDLLNTNVVVIFILMICVSGFTLVSSMFIIILERIPTIGILRALGASKKQIRSIFVYMTLKIVGYGLIIGNIIGIGLLLIQQHYQVIPLDPEMYYLQTVPVELNIPYLICLNIGVIVVSWLILILPSRLASKISPTVTMRFE